MSVVLTPFREEAVATLQAFRDSLGITGDAARLIDVLTDEARGCGRQVIVGWEAGVPTGCAGWVDFRVPSSGEMMGAPLQASTAAVAEALVNELIQRAHSLHAQSLVVGVAPGEDVKEVVLLSMGFELNAERAHVSCATNATNATFSRSGLQPLAFSALDGEQLSALYRDVFPHWADDPASQAQNILQDWATFDWNASTVLADGNGRYAAFLTVSPRGEVCDIGVAAEWRGRGIARSLYDHASGVLARHGVGAMSAGVDTYNTASMRFHEQLGFREDRARHRTYCLALAA